MAADAVPADVNAQAQADEDDNGRRRRHLLLSTAAAVLLLLVLLLIWLMLARVPDVIGMNAYTAQRVLTKAGFKVGDIGRTTAGKVDPGLTAWQSVLGGAWRLKGSTIDLKLKTGVGAALPPSSGGASGGAITGVTPWWATDSIVKQPTETIVPSGAIKSLGGVPEVLNMTIPQARATLAAKGYGMVVRYGPSTAGVARDLVYYQKPSKSQPLAKGSSVVVWVSTGPLRQGFRYPQPEPDPEVK